MMAALRRELLSPVVTTSRHAESTMNTVSFRGRSVTGQLTISRRPINLTNIIEVLDWSTTSRLIVLPSAQFALAAGRPVIGISLMAARLETVFEMVTHFQRLAEHEKASLARELHDELGGFLISAVMDLCILSLREALHSAIADNPSLD
jgi:signal transduction histidine kinase